MVESSWKVDDAGDQACAVKKKFQWRVFWVSVILVVGIVLFLPMKLITTGQGYLAPWFIVYAAFATSAFAIIGGLILKKRCLPAVPPPFVKSVSEVESALPEDVEVELSPEDRELLYSIKELLDWFEEGKITETRYRDYRTRVAELERWLRTGIKKDIEIRNLRRELRKLREELERVRAVHNEGRETS
jgi:hypothetical protein